MNLKKIIASIFVILMGINVTVSAKPVIVDLNDENFSVPEKFKTYRKCSGLLKADLYSLPVVSKGVIVDESLSLSDIAEIKESVGSIFMCRTDAPAKDWFSLPGGRELHVEQINAFLAVCKKANPRAALLCFLLPSLHFTGKAIERYNKSGSSNVIIDWGKGITIEYVGQGFDGSELTKGKSRSHTSIFIPWSVSEWPAEFIWDFATIENITKESYNLSRNHRIKSLLDLGYNEEIVELAVPKTPVYMDRKMFVDIFNNCVKDIIECAQDFDSSVPTMLLIDLYGQKQHVVEIWNSNL